jgi:hypothetical protein
MAARVTGGSGGGPDTWPPAVRQRTQIRRTGSPRGAASAILSVSTEMKKATIKGR